MSDGGWNDYGYTTIDPLTTPMSEDPGTHWFPSNTLESKLESELTAVDTQVLGLLFGAEVPHYQSPEHSVLITYTDTASGAPAFPSIPHAHWWQRAKRRRNAETWRAYTDALDAWHAAGRPDREIEVRRYIPRARLNG